MPWRICLLGVIAATLVGSARADDRTWATTGFGDGGMVSGAPVDAIAAAPDGTIIVADGGLIERYSADGRRIGFGPRHKPFTISTGAAYCRPGLAVRSDGTILAACGETIAALRPSGAVKSLTTVAGANFDAVAVGFLDRTVAAGTDLIRLNADGSIDDSFARTTLTSPASAVVVDGGQTLVVAGGAIRSYDDYGQLDTAFGNAGVAAFPGFIATSVGAYSHWIFAGGSLGDQAAVVRFFAGGMLDTSFGTEGVTAWGRDKYKQSARVVALGVRTGGEVDTAVESVGVADVYDSYENPEDWLVQRLTFAGQLDASVNPAYNYIDPTEECLQAFPVALAEQANGKTLITGVVCPDAVDYTTYSLLERYNAYLAPDLGVALNAHVIDVHVHGFNVTVHVGVNGPCRLIARVQQLDGNTPIGYWLAPKAADVAHGPALIHLRLNRNDLSPHVRYAVVVSAYDARGLSVSAHAPLER